MAGQGEFTARVTKCNDAYKGKNANGVDYTRYECVIAKETGEVYQQKFNSFEPLPVGVLVELKWKKFDSDQYGESFTLSLKNKADKPTAAAPPTTGPPPGSAPSADGRVPEQLAHDLKLLSDRLRRVEAYLAGKPWAAATTVSPPPQQEFAPASTQLATGAPGDDDIPF